MDELFFHYTDAIMIIQQQQEKRTITSLNNAFAIVSGYSPNQLVGRQLAALHDLYPSELWELIDRLCDTITDKQLSRNAERELTVQENKPIYAELYVTRIHEAEGTSFMVTLHDRSEYKWIEKANKQTVICSSIYTGTGLIKSLRFYHVELPYDRGQLSMINRKDFIAEEDFTRVRQFMHQIRDTREIGQISFALHIMEDKYRITILVKPFYNADCSFKCYAILVLSMIPQNGSKFKVAMKKKSIGDSSDRDQMEAGMDGIGTVVSSQEADSAYKLRLLMLEKNVSVTQLAERTQISLTTISNIRNGKIKKPQRLTAHLIATELGVSTEDIWGE